MKKKNSPTVEISASLEENSKMKDESKSFSFDDCFYDYDDCYNYDDYDDDYLEYECDFEDNVIRCKKVTKRGITEEELEFVRKIIDEYSNSNANTKNENNKENEQDKQNQEEIDLKKRKLEELFSRIEILLIKFLRAEHEQEQKKVEQAFKNLKDSISGSFKDECKLDNNDVAFFESYIKKYDLNNMHERKKFLRDVKERMEKHGLNLMKDVAHRRVSTLFLYKILYYLGNITENSLDEIKSSLNNLDKEHMRIVDYIEELPVNIVRNVIYKTKDIVNHLDQKIYGLENVKNSLITIFKLQKISKNFIGKRILLYGPPGVGKTLFGQAIAEILGLPFIKINFSSAYDRGAFKGLYKTYGSSDAGMFARELIRVGCLNPVILIDEIDKSGETSGGKVIDILTEILDPIQGGLKDEFLGITCDMSKAIIICTANDISNIPEHILDRLEKIKVNNYSKKDRFYIIKNHLPKQIIEKENLIVKIELDDELVKKMANSTLGFREIGNIIKNMLAKKIDDDIEYKEGDTICLELADFPEEDLLSNSSCTKRKMGFF